MKQRQDEVKTVTWAKKNIKSYFRYKLHSKMETEHEFIRDIKTTPASLYDSQVDLSKEGGKWFKNC
ncbi:MAG: hypothetical protein EF812_06680 [Methanosarcinales archaeon]|nr:MAG: hypothetical protein EF812_06680 [Methanosarcinales archaeon]